MVKYVTQDKVFDAQQKTISALKSLDEEEIKSLKLFIEFDENEEDVIRDWIDDSDALFGLDWESALLSEEYVKGFYKQLKREKYAERYAISRRWNFIHSGNKTWQVLHRDLRKTVFERDGYKCVKCGKNKALHLHHLKTRSEFPELEFEVSNCVTLCKECHRKEHADLRFMQ